VLPEIQAFDLDEIPAAFRESEGGHVRGKLVIKVAAPAAAKAGEGVAEPVTA
jgi:hypothetical protein